MSNYYSTTLPDMDRYSYVQESTTKSKKLKKKPKNKQNKENGKCAFNYI